MSRRGWLRSEVTNEQVDLHRFLARLPAIGVWGPVPLGSADIFEHPHQLLANGRGLGNRDPPVAGTQQRFAVRLSTR